VNEVNFVEGRDSFISGDAYDLTVIYNYGRPIRIRRQKFDLIDDDQVFFNENMILEVLNSMPLENNIRYTRSEDSIHLEGTLSNFPHLIINSGNAQIPIEIVGSVLRLNTEGTSNRIGVRSLKSYSKIQISEWDIVLKRSSFNIVLYVFLGLFIVLSLVLTISCRREVEFTLGFVQLLFRSVILKDNRARVNVLMTELE
jgi:hypothetical protein